MRLQGLSPKEVKKTDPKTEVKKEKGGGDDAPGVDSRPGAAAREASGDDFSLRAW